jgi:hypothetical protein
VPFVGRVHDVDLDLETRRSCRSRGELDKPETVVARHHRVGACGTSDANGSFPVLRVRIECCGRWTLAVFDH